MRLQVTRKWMIAPMLIGAIAAITSSAPALVAGGNEVNFSLTDTPGRWFDTGVDIAGTRSLAVATPGVRVNFSGNSNTVHTRTSLIFPTGAAGMPFTTDPRKGGDSVTLTTPGLYVFTCGTHPYIFRGRFERERERQRRRLSRPHRLTGRRSFFARPLSS